MYFIQTKVVYDCFKLIGILKLLNLKMPQSLQIQTQKNNEEAKSCMKVKNAKAIEKNRENVMKTQTKQENQNCKKFVTLNKRKTFENFGGKVLENIKEFENQGFINLNILVFYLIWYSRSS